MRRTRPSIQAKLCPRQTNLCVPLGEEPLLARGAIAGFSVESQRTTVKNELKGTNIWTGLPFANAPPLVLTVRHLLVFLIVAMERGGGGGKVPSGQNL
jgi:hypothetical protein